MQKKKREDRGYKSPETERRAHSHIVRHTFNVSDVDINKFFTPLPKKAKK